MRNVSLISSQWCAISQVKVRARLEARDPAVGVVEPGERGRQFHIANIGPGGGEALCRILDQRGRVAGSTSSQLCAR